MKILFLTNNEVSYPLYEWLMEREEVALFKDRVDTQIIDRYKPDFIITYSYKYIIKGGVIDLMKGKIINLHISLLPWNKGADPKWSFLEDTPKGVTIHLIDRDVNTKMDYKITKVMMEKED